MTKSIQLVCGLVLILLAGTFFYKPYMNFSAFLRAKCFLTNTCVMDLSDYKKHYDWDEFCLQHRRGVFASQVAKVKCDFCYLISLKDDNDNVLVKDFVRINVADELFDTNIESKNTCYSRDDTTIFVDKYSRFSILKYHVNFHDDNQ